MGKRKAQARKQHIATKKITPIRAKKVVKNGGKMVAELALERAEEVVEEELGNNAERVPKYNEDDSRGEPTTFDPSKLMEGVIKKRTEE